MVDLCRGWRGAVQAWPLEAQEGLKAPRSADSFVRAKVRDRAAARGQSCPRSRGKHFRPGGSNRRLARAVIPRKPFSANSYQTADAGLKRPELDRRPSRFERT